MTRARAALALIVATYPAAEAGRIDEAAERGRVDLERDPVPGLVEGLDREACGA